MNITTENLYYIPFSVDVINEFCRVVGWSLGLLNLVFPWSNLVDSFEF